MLINEATENGRKYVQIKRLINYYLPKYIKILMIAKIPTNSLIKYDLLMAFFQTRQGQQVDEKVLNISKQHAIANQNHKDRAQVVV